MVLFNSGLAFLFHFYNQLFPCSGTLGGEVCVEDLNNKQIHESIVIFATIPVYSLPFSRTLTFLPTGIWG